MGCKFEKCKGLNSPVQREGRGLWWWDQVWRWCVLILLISVSPSCCHQHPHTQFLLLFLLPFFHPLLLLFLLQWSTLPGDTRSIPRLHQMGCQWWILPARCGRSQTPSSLRLAISITVANICHVDRPELFFPQLDAPVSPGARGFTAFLKGVSDEQRQRHRELIFATSKDELVGAARR